MQENGKRKLKKRKNVKQRQPEKAEVSTESHSEEGKSFEFGASLFSIIFSILTNKPLPKRKLACRPEEFLVLKIFLKRQGYIVLDSLHDIETLGDLRYHLVSKRIEERVKHVFKLTVSYMKEAVIIPNRGALENRLKKMGFQRRDAFFFHFFFEFCSDPRNQTQFVSLFKQRKGRQVESKGSVDEDFTRAAIGVNFLKKVSGCEKFFGHPKLKEFLNVNSEDLFYPKRLREGGRPVNILLFNEKKIANKLKKLVAEWRQIYESKEDFEDFERKMLFWFNKKHCKLPWSFSNTIFSVEIFKDSIFRS